MNRRPTASFQSGAIPSLTALLAAGAQLAGCHEPMCQSSRAAELNVHGRAAVTQVRGAHGSEALRSLNVATGLVIHPATPVVVQPTEVDGGVGEVISVPPAVPPVPTVPTPEPQNVPGGLRPTTVVPPTTPTAPTAPRHQRVRTGQHPAPAHFEPHMLGDVGAVMAVPASSTQRPA